MTERLNLKDYNLSTKLIGDSELTVVNNHLRYRRDQVEFPGGYRGEYTYIDDEFPAVGVAALDKRMGKRTLLMVLQERYPSQTVGWEIPAGGVDERGLEFAARNELEQEGGLAAETWHRLPQQVENTGRGNSRMDLFIATGITEEQWIRKKVKSSLIENGSLLMKSRILCSMAK